ncbi:MAG: hypothetical protein ACREQ7_18555 [Candidatus Binatia bacterium]
MNRDYQKFAKADLERGLSHLARGEDLLPEAFQAFWGVYENCLNCLSIAPGKTAHERNLAFERHLHEVGLYQRVLDALFRHTAAHCGNKVKAYADDFGSESDALMPDNTIPWQKNGDNT